MGDHRADIKITMHLHGKPYKWDASINYWPDDDGVDRRIKEWFADCWDRALGVYAEQIAEYEAREARRRDLAELARLRAKYGADEAP